MQIILISSVTTNSYWGYIQILRNMCKWWEKTAQRIIARASTFPCCTHWLILSGVSYANFPNFLIHMWIFRLAGFLWNFLHISGFRWHGLHVFWFVLRCKDFEFFFHAISIWNPWYVFINPVSSKKKCKQKISLKQFAFILFSRFIFAVILDAIVVVTHVVALMIYQGQI